MLFSHYYDNSSSVRMLFSHNYDNSSSIARLTYKVLVEQVEHPPAPHVFPEPACLDKLCVIQKVRPVLIHRLPTLEPGQAHVSRHLHCFENLFKLTPASM